MVQGDRQTPPELVARARKAQELRGTMTTVSLPAELFVDPAWDMMIELMIAEGEFRPLCVKDLIVLSGESAASAMRRIVRLEEAGLLVRTPDRADHRRVHVTLTLKGHGAMAAMLERLFDSGSGPGGPAAPLSFRPGGLR
ncbi:MarR family transcriptional regulator [Sphingomonas aracearum]|uniref:MarR family transcriptional regulator n=1 Tax=Sphingomonas aracearum TaxID=2283317 RepID=A0A369VSH9_9SPHN|nr:MarR family transcriptional regulator [Sphingomonas aracearum]